MDNQKYFNPGQLEAMIVSARDEYIVASRGFGKSEGIDAPRLLRNVHEMPRSVGAILSPTYKKLNINTLPAVSKALSRYGYHRNIHYFVGRKAPARMNFAMPHTEPFDWSYCIHWYNGSVQNMISFDQNMSANSMSLDYILGFEAKFLDYEKIKTEVLPANRGNRELYGYCPWHHGSVYTTDMPTSRLGNWILDKREAMDTTLIDLIKITYADLFEAQQTLTAAPGSRSIQNCVTTLAKKLASLRTGYKTSAGEFNSTTFYAEYSAFENFEILGEQFFRDMKRDLPPLIFKTAILNIRPGRVENGFYSSLNERIHYYTANNNHYLDETIRGDTYLYSAAGSRQRIGSAQYDFAAITDETSLHDSDSDAHAPLAIANDYNAAINSLVCGQVQKQGRTQVIRTLRSFFVKTPKKLPDVAREWCRYYRNHLRRDVVYYYDSTAIYDNPINSETFKDSVIKVLTSEGWHVTEVYIGKPMKHHTKHHHINQALKGDNTYLFPLFNRDNNPYLLFAMEQTGIVISKNSFEKDKSAEKDPDTPQSPDEKKTHITDAWDTLFIGTNFYRHEPSHVPLTTRILSSS